MRSLLFSRSFFLLWQGQLVSQLGGQAFLVATMYWTMETTGSASFIGIVMMLSTLPMVVLGPFGGTLADWYSRKTIIIASDVICGISVLSLAGLMFFFPEAPAAGFLCLCVVTAIVGCVRAFFQPAISAAIPDLVDAERMPAANSMMQFSAQASTFVGQGLGGMLYRLLGAPALFLIDGLTYLLSALSEAFIELPVVERKPAASPRAAFAAFWADTKAGFEYVWQNRGMRFLLLTSSSINFFVVPVFVLLPFYAEDHLGAGAAWYGFLLAALSGGAILGYIAGGVVPRGGRSRGALLIGSFLGVAVLIGALGFTSSRFTALGLLIAIGVLSGLINVHAITLFQTRSLPALRGRVMSLVITLATAVAPLGMLLGGILGDATGKNLPLIYGTCGAGAAIVLIAASSSTAFRSFLAAPLRPPGTEQTAATS
ncbi:MAG: MFS transporter [Woeseia sp.]